MISTKEKTDIQDHLVKRCKHGDAKAQYQLYQLYAGAMYNTALRFFKNKMVAEDILQEAFVQAFTKIDTLKNNGTFGSWLKRIVVNKCISELNCRNIRFEELNAHTDYQEEEIDETVDPKWVNHAIKSLPDGARAIFNLHAVEGYKHREIAEMLNISESTSKSQYVRAKQLLPNLINQFAESNALT